MELLKRLRPITVTAVAAGVLLGGTACTRVNSFQTLEPYTPAEGVPVDIQRQPTAEEREQQINPIPIKVNNLMIVETGAGEGFVSGTVVSPIDTQLESIEGQALDQAAAPAGNIQFSDAANPVRADHPLILTHEQNAFAQPSGDATPTNADYAQITAQSPDMKAGLLARVTITFADGETTVDVPVVDGEKAPYQDITQEPEPIEVDNG